MAINTKSKITAVLAPWLAAGALVAGAAFSATPIALATPYSGDWDLEEYDKCMADGKERPIDCCIQSGGQDIGDDEVHCAAPPAERSPEQNTGGKKPVVVVPKVPLSQQVRG